ncbi:membrane protein [Staphylococcus phage Alsa_3]|nr:membrane protein [Staphylococcus phage Alsa_3]WNM51328.1 membrane protein [Staphylococcus phage Alsa_4]
MPDILFGIAIGFVILGIFSIITQRMKLLGVSIAILFSYLLLLMIANNYAEKETDTSIISNAQTVKKLNSTIIELSDNVHYHTSDITYVKKTEYRVSKDSPFYLIKGDNIVDTKYDIYLEK